jgi:hypothetical protein
VWFVDGYLDAYIYDYKKPAKDLEDSYEDLITDFYTRKADQLGILVGDAIGRLQELPARPPRTGGEPCKGPRGCANGIDLWAAGSRLARESYVAGILSCLKERLPQEGRRYSKSPAEYVTLIDKWYGFNEETEEMDPKRGKEAIAIVLRKFRDPVAPQKPRKH